MGFPQYIGFVGVSGSGKTEITNRLSMRLKNYREFTFLSFSDGVKGMLRDMVGKVGYVGIPAVNKRKALQMLGTDLMRNLIDESFWIREWHVCDRRYRAAFKNLDADGLTTMVDAVRFRNEAEFLMTLEGGCVLIGVVRPGLTVGEDWRQHESERGIEDLLPLCERTLVMGEGEQALKDGVNRLAEWLIKEYGL